MTTLKEVLAFIATSTVDDRRAISNELRYRVEDENYKAKAELKVGDKVEFKPNKRNHPYVVRGVVVAKRAKRVEVRPENGGRNWVVSPVLLTKLPTTSPQT